MSWIEIDRVADEIQRVEISSRTRRKNEEEVAGARVCEEEGCLP